jgi:membrane protein
MSVYARATKRQYCLVGGTSRGPAYMTPPFFPHETSRDTNHGTCFHNGSRTMLPDSRAGLALAYQETRESMSSRQGVTAAEQVKGPTQLPRRAWGDVLKRTFSEFREDNVTDWAAALTYYGVLSIFPALIALVSVLGVVGESATNPLLDNLKGFAPGPAEKILSNALHGLNDSRGGASILFIVGIAGAIWSASSYIGAFIRASNAIWDVEEGRPFTKTIPLRLVITLVMLILLTATAVAVAVTGPLADKVGELIGVGSTAVTVWDIAKWPVLVLVVALMFGILFYAAPNVRQPGFRWVTPGAIVAVIAWMIVSALFGVYVANFGSYNKTYGSLGAIIIFLVWLWLTNIAILLGAELNAETQRGRQIEAGHPREREPFLPPRDAPA